MIDGICCEYCKKNETSDCPVKTAYPWSRWKNFCSEFDGEKKLVASMRPVRVYEYKKVEGQSHLGKQYIYDAIFHQFGCDYAEFETGPGNYTTAIVELSNGEIKNIPVELVVFVDFTE